MHIDAELAASEHQTCLSLRKRPTVGETALTFLQSQSRQLQGISAGLDLGFPIRRCNGDMHAAIQVNVVVCWATFPVPSLHALLGEGCSPHSLRWWILTRGSATMRKVRRHICWSCTHKRQWRCSFRRKNKKLSLLLTSSGPRVCLGHMERVLGEKLLLPHRRNQSENLQVYSCLRRAAMSAKHSRLMAASTSTAALASAPRTVSANLSLHLNVERLAEQWIYSPIGIHGCSRALWSGATRQSISENTEEVLHVSIMLPDIHPRVTAKLLPWGLFKLEAEVYCWKAHCADANVALNADDKSKQHMQTSRGAVFSDRSKSQAVSLYKMLSYFKNMGSFFGASLVISVRDNYYSQEKLIWKSDTLCLPGTLLVPRPNLVFCPLPSVIWSHGEVLVLMVCV